MTEVGKIELSNLSTVELSVKVFNLEMELLALKGEIAKIRQAQLPTKEEE